MKRKFLTDLGITDADIIKQIIDYHQEVVKDFKDDVGALREELKKAKAALEVAVQEKEAMNQSDDGIDWKEEHDKLKAEYDKFRNHVKEAKSRQEKRSIARDVLIKNGVKEDILDDFMLDAINYDEVAIKDGQLENASDFVASQKSRYGKYFGAVTTQGLEVATPPAGNGAAPNPWKKGEHYSLKQQTEMYRDDPARARKMASEAGIEL